MQFNFNQYQTRVFISQETPSIENIAAGLGVDSINGLVVADENTSSIADKICAGHKLPRCILKSGEGFKTWESAQAILAAAHNAGLDRDGVFIGVGGGVIGDLTGFAASIYKRGSRLVLVPTTLLAMVDASIGGKTGINMFGVKNLTGAFYPAQIVYMPLSSLSSLAESEWKNGIAELIKTAILAGDDFLDEISAAFANSYKQIENEVLQKYIEKAVVYKGNIVSKDLYESGQRMLLNLGHTFGHALEAAAAFAGKKISHGEAVAWGITRGCDLGVTLGVCPAKRAQKIQALLKTFGFETASVHPLMENNETFAAFMQALYSDKKKRSGIMNFIVPDENSARIVQADTDVISKLFK